jgi:hypothetical protein
MFQKFTPNVSKENSSVVMNDNRHILNPKKQTLSFIKQFACAYHVENNLPASLSTIVLN